MVLRNLIGGRISNFPHSLFSFSDCLCFIKGHQCSLRHIIMGVRSIDRYDNLGTGTHFIFVIRISFSHLIYLAPTITKCKKYAVKMFTSGNTSKHIFRIFQNKKICMNWFLIFLERIGTVSYQIQSYFYHTIIHIFATEVK